MGQPQSKDHENEFFKYREFSEPNFPSTNLDDKVQDENSDSSRNFPSYDTSLQKRDSKNEKIKNENENLYNNNEMKKPEPKKNQKAVELQDVPSKKNTMKDIFTLNDNIGIFEDPLQKKDISSNVRDNDDSPLGSFKSYDSFGSHKNTLEKSPKLSDFHPHSQEKENSTKNTKNTQNLNNHTLNPILEKEENENKEEQGEDDPEAEILCEWLTKQTVMNYGKDDDRKVNNSVWKNRLFVLKRGCIYYYLIQDAGKYEVSEKITITRENITPELLVRKRGKESVVGYPFSISFPETTGINFFEVQWKQNILSTQITPPTRTFQFAAQTEKDLKRWLDFFNNTNSKKYSEIIENENLSRDLKISKKNGIIEIKGNLMVFQSETKWSGNTRYWDERQIVFKFLPPKEPEFHVSGVSTGKRWELLIQKRDERGYFPLTNCIVESEDAFSIDILSPTQTINIRCREMEQRNRWKKAIEYEIFRLKNENKENFLKDRVGFDLVGKLEIVIKDETKRMKEEEELKKDIKSPLYPEKKNFFILSIDGGGLRGIITTLILSRLMGHFPDLIDRVDLITGCSNGGMVAMSLADGWDPKFCHTLLELTGNLIFKKNFLQNKMSRAMFPNHHVKLLCDTIWKEKKLKEASKRVVIPAFLMDNENENPEKRSCETKIFHNLDNNPQNGCEDLMSDIVMRTCAAPTFFPSFQNYVDGGLFAHDPSSSALMYTIGPKLKIPTDRIVLLSLGTGRVLRYYPQDNKTEPKTEPNPENPENEPKNENLKTKNETSHDWGYVQWLPKLAHCFWDGMLMKSSMLCEEILGKQFFRLDPTLEEEISMDDPLMIPRLTQVARETDLTKLVQWIHENVYEE